MDPINPTHIRYIKLGAGGGWADLCIKRGEMHFGYPQVPHDLCVSGDWEAVADYLINETGRGKAKANDAVREIRDFYTLGPECLWITFADGHLYWAFAAPEVTWRGGDPEDGGNRMRKTVDGWHRTSIVGTPLRQDNLSSWLTQVASYRQTICAVKAEDYVIRRINDIEEPVVRDAKYAKAAMIASATKMIETLHWADFETMVDLIFARTGWQRTSRVGETMKDVDLILQHPTTGESASVQVKSKATQRVLDESVNYYRRSGIWDRMYFVCHSPKGNLAADIPKFHLWTGGTLADAAVKAGLFDWLMERTG